MKKRFRNPNKIDLPHDIDQESLLSLYDRESKDLELFNSIDAEVIKLSGSKLLYYKVFINENYDRVYLEERNKVIAKDPIVVWASFDPKPIEESVSEFGLELTNDQVFVFNKSYVERAIGRAPQPGDVVESPVQNIKYEIYEVQEDSFEVYGVFHYNCYGRVLRDSLDVVDEPALETFEEVGADLLISRRDYGDLMSASLTNADLSVGGVDSPTDTPGPAISDPEIVALFANDEVGAWYDPSDSETVFQDAAGTTPATVGDPVGLILDKSKGLTLGSELAINGTFDTDTGWAKGAGWTISGGVAQKAGGSANSYFSQNQGLTVGRWYKVEMDISGSQGVTDFVQLYDGVAVLASFVGFNGHVSAIVKVRADYVMLRGVTPNVTITVDNFSVKELPGNHASQTTSTARPILQQSGATPVLSGSELVTTSFPASYTNYTGYITLGPSKNVGSWYKYQYTLSSVTTGGVAIHPERVGLYDGNGTHSYEIYSTSTALRFYANNFTGSIDNISVQEVTSWSGGLRYLDFDGVDDLLVTAAIDMTATDQIDYGLGARRDRVSSTEIVSEFGLTSSSFGHYFSAFTPGSELLYVANGNVASGPSMNASYSPVGASSFINVSQNEIDSPLTSIRLNGSLVASNTASRGTGNFGTWPLHIGARSGGLFQFDGAIYSYVMIGRTLTAQEIEDLEAYLAEKSGVTLATAPVGP